MTVAQLLTLVTLPIGLGDRALTELAQLWDYWAPRDVFERFLVTRLLQAVARLELSAQREPLDTDSLWLRHEQAADRLYRQSFAALQKHRIENPVELTVPTSVEATSPEPAPRAFTPTTGPIPAPDSPSPATQPARRVPAPLWPTPSSALHSQTPITPTLSSPTRSQSESTT